METSSIDHKKLKLDTLMGCRTLIDDLPNECIAAVFGFLHSSRDRCSCAAVSRRWLHLMATAKVPAAVAESPSPRSFSRRLMGTKANDVRLAALAVRARHHPRLALTCLCIMGVPRLSSPSPSWSVTDYGLEIIARASPSLKSLNVWDCDSVGDAGFKAVGEWCRDLESLHLINLPMAGDDGLSSIASNCPKLSSLSIESCPLIGTESLHVIARKSPKLRAISLVKCPRVQDAGIVSAVSTLPELARLRISTMKIGDEVIDAAANRCWPALRSLHLEKINGPTEIGYSRIASMDELRSLKLRLCFGLTGGSLISGRFDHMKLARLKEIEVQRCGTLTDEILTELSKSCERLKSLRLEECVGFTSKGVIESIKNRGETLKLLCLVKCRIKCAVSTEPGDHCECEYPRLSTLELKRCDGVDDELLSMLGHACSQAREVSLVGMGSFSDQGLRRLLIFMNPPKRLAILDLSGCTAVSVRALCDVVEAYGAGLKCLKLAGCGGADDCTMATVAVHCVALEELNVDGCASITDLGLWCLVYAGKDRLRSLSLAGCGGVSDDGLRCLEQMTWDNLKLLDIRRCPRISKHRVACFQESIWWCKVMS